MQGFRAYGSYFRGQGSDSDFWVQVEGFKTWGLGFTFRGWGFDLVNEVEGSCCRVQGPVSGFWVSGLGFWVEGLGLRPCR